MKIVHRQHFLLALGEPLLASVGLAFRTMPISAGVIGDAGAISAAGTVIEMAPQGSRAATGDSQEHFDLRPSQRRSIAFPEPTASDADDVGHLPGWPGHNFGWDHLGTKTPCFMASYSVVSGARTIESSCAFGSSLYKTFRRHGLHLRAGLVQHGGVHAMEGTVYRGRTHAVRIAAEGRGEHGLVVPRVRHLPGYRLQNLCAL